MIITSTDVPGDRTHVGGAKKERYKWAEAGEKGRLVWIPKDDLHVNRSYQRVLTESKVKQIAANWMWPAFGVLTVGTRDGSHYVMEGQHRWAAALRRSDISSLPCVVFTMKHVAEEAHVFLTANTLRRPVSAVEKFSASIIEGSPPAIKLSELIAKTGRVVTQNPKMHNGIRCIAALLDLQSTNASALERVLPMASEICRDRSLNERIVRALHFIEVQLLRDGGRSLSVPNWRKRILSISYETYLDHINRAAVFYARGGDKVFAHGALEAINRGLRIRLKLNTTGRNEDVEA